MQKNCPSCGQTVQITPAMAGKTITCPHCAHRLKVPALAKPAGGRAAMQAPHAAADPSRHDEGVVVQTEPHAKSSSGLERYRHRKNSRQSVVTIAVVATCFAAVATLLMMLLPSTPPPELAPVNDLRVMENQTIRQPLKLTNPTEWDGKVTYQMVEGPSGATVDPRSGLFSWKPGANDCGAARPVTVQVRAMENPERADSTSFSITVIRKNLKPLLTLPANARVVVGETLRATIVAHDPDDPATLLRFALVKSPPGATLDAQSGELQWTVPEDTPAGSVLFAVRVQEDSPEGLHATGQFRVTTTLPPRPADRLLDKLHELGLPADISREPFEHSFGGTGATLHLGNEEIRCIEYADEEATREDVLKIAKDRASLQMPALPSSWIGPTRYFAGDRLLLIYAGLTQELVEKLTQVLGEPLASSEASSRSSGIPALDTSPTDPGPAQAAPGTFQEEESEQLAAWHENGQLFRSRSYAGLRRIYAARFARDQAEVLDKVWGDDPDLLQWLDEHGEIKEEFFTAINPAVDDVSTCLQLFQSLYRKYPETIQSYANLAIAIAVTWDNRKAVEMDLGPMRQAKAVAPDDPADAEQSFAYFLQNERVMQGRAQILPWEFLVHVVNHTTPLVERQWVLANYLDKRVNFGSCYKTVPYDTEMLDSQGKAGRIHGKIYTLPNILQYGGVCAHQADFAARVGKSLGIPAAYVSGESTYGENHAWVMWVELQPVTSQGIRFTLESFGRYRGDKYYVGRLREPQSGESITDRQLELRLHTVGSGPAVKRQSDWVMGAFETICQEQSLSIVQQFLYLRDTLELCAGNERAWIALSKMSSNAEVREKHRKDMAKVLDQLFTTFARFPDFTWTIFDDLIAFEESLDKRIALYARLVALYELQGRPDLACEARLKLADMLVENNQATDAIEGLAFSIRKFPEEGRYVPKMLDKLESICAETDVTREQLVPFYHSFLPLIPRMRGSRPSKYCMQMYERGIARFQEAGANQLAQLYAAQLQQIRAGETK